jgi:hypothetical protein
MILGIEDPQIIIGYALSIGLAVFCVIWGWLHWNDKEDPGKK